MIHSSSQTNPSLIAELPPEERPREKAIAHGIKSLSDAELMAIIFATGIKGKSVVQLCEEILADNNNHISKVAKMSVEEVTKRYKGIGPAKALTMLAALELGTRSAADAILVDEKPISSSQLGYDYMKPYLEALDHEEFWVLLLKQNLRPLKAIRIGQGGVAATVVDLKILFREALRHSSPAMMVFHNHPSGSVIPSGQDNTLTHRILEGGKLLEIRLLDHIIIGDNTYYSYYDSGNLK